MEKIFDLIAGLFAGSDQKQMHMLLLVTTAVICSLFGCMVYHLYKKGKQFKEEDTGKKLYDSLEEAFREEPYGMYYKLQKWLKQEGG